MRTVLVYYGWPSLINGATSVRQAVSELGRYDYLILGAGLEDPGHPDHERTRQIIADVPSIVFGYVDLGVTTSGFLMGEIERRCEQWLHMDADGVMFDDAGSDFGVDDTRRGQSVKACWELGLLACVNVWNPGEACGDFVLAESWWVQDGVLAKGRRRRARQIRRTGLDVLSVATGTFDRRLYRRALRAAVRFGHAGFGWGEPDYSVDSRAPWRQGGQT